MSDNPNVAVLRERLAGLAEALDRRRYPENAELVRAAIAALQAQASAPPEQAGMVQCTFCRRWSNLSSSRMLQEVPAEQASAPGGEVTEEMVRVGEAARVESLRAITVYGSAGVEERHHMAMRDGLTAALAARTGKGEG